MADGTQDQAKEQFLEGMANLKETEKEADKLSEEHRAHAELHAQDLRKIELRRLEQEYEHKEAQFVQTNVQQQQEYRKKLQISSEELKLLKAENKMRGWLPTSVFCFTGSVMFAFFGILLLQGFNAGGFNIDSTVLSSVGVSAVGGSPISTLQFDVDFEVAPLESKNPLAPTHRVMAYSPKGKLIEVGGVWRKFSKTDGAEYFTINIRDYRFNANLGQAAHQDDTKVQAVIPWGPVDIAA